MRKLTTKLGFTGLLCLAGAAHATSLTDYYVVVPLPGKAQAACTTPWNTLIKSGDQVTAYANPNPAFGTSCEAVAQVRQCSAGVLSGDASFSYKDCVPQLSTTTWDPNNIWANGGVKTTGNGPRVTLWNNNLTVAEGSGGYSDGSPFAYTTQARSAGKWYFEILVNNTLYRDLYLGFGNGLPTGWSATIMSEFSGGWGGSASGSQPYFTGATRVGFAVDLDSNKVWLSTNCNWTTGTPGVAAPAATLTGRSGAIKPMWHGGYTWAYGYQNQVTANFGNEAFACPVPAGFTAGW